MGAIGEINSFPQTTTSTMTDFEWPPFTVAVLAPIKMLSLNPLVVKILSFALPGRFPFSRSTCETVEELMLG
jgi:hypothetical protein